MTEMLKLIDLFDNLCLLALGDMAVLVIAAMAMRGLSPPAL